MLAAPHWDLTNVYPSLDSKEFKGAFEEFKRQIASLEKFFTAKLG